MTIRGPEELEEPAGFADGQWTERLVPGGFQQDLTPLPHRVSLLGALPSKSIPVSSGSGLQTQPGVDTSHQAPQVQPQKCGVQAE